MEGGEAGVVAVTKVFAIRVRLDDRVRYITDGEKTSLASSITYISNPEKTEQFFFTSALNCSSVDTALSEMMETKQQFGKMGGVLGYHFIQSFQPGEVTPEQAHAVGLEFAKRLFGKRYEVVISTHLNKHHLHNHLVVNSVSYIDGQKYHSSPESYYNDVRGTSDELCRENDLSVITPQGKGKHYAEWKAEQGGKPTVRGIIRADIDTIIGQAYTYDSFLMLLRRNGYEVRRNPNRKYTTVKPPGAKRAIRLDSLGKGYTEADILLRLSRQRHGGMTPPTVTHAVKRYRIKGKLATVRKKKIIGFHALYLRYLYLLRGNRRKKLPPKLPFSVKREVIHLERYEQQFKYLLSSGITTETELEQRIRVLEWDIRLLEEQRKPLYQERRNTSDEETQAKYSAEIQQQTAALREKRGELRLCRRIQADIPRVSQQCQQAQAERQENLKNKEEHEHEYETSIYGLNEGNYYVVAYLNNHYYLGEKVTVNYTAATADISLDTTGPVNFGEVEKGYTTAPAAKTVTITNNGTAATGALTIALDGTHASSFKLSKDNISDIAAGGNATFTVQPKTGLPAGTYTATVKVSGTGLTEKSFDVQFTVKDGTSSLIGDVNGDGTI